MAALYPSTFLGLSLMRANALAISSSETLEKSVPLGKNSLTRPLVFSLVPFSQGVVRLAEVELDDA